MSTTISVWKRWKRTKGQAMIYKTPHRKQKIKQHEPQWNMGWIAEELTVPSSTSVIRPPTVKKHEHHRGTHHNTELKLMAVLLTCHFVLETLCRTFHRWILSNFNSFGQMVLENIFLIGQSQLFLQESNNSLCVPPSFRGEDCFRC